MRKIRSNKLAGFTLDQTILVVAVIAVLATIIISSVAWNVLSKANATKINAHLQQYTDAIGTFYQEGDGINLNIWPEKAQDISRYLAGYTKSGTDHLTTPFGTTSTPSVLELHGGVDGSGNDLPGFKLSTDGGAATACAGSELDCYITVTISNMQAQEVIQANDSIDGPSEGSNSNKSTKGRLRWDIPTASGTARVKVTYFAVRKF
ncbi:MAG TPA: hypothetical protein DCL21_02400 [Alphaproteobacteria bacterium]|nr:hypothetical protein [Alphaproteobacteria bacterium]